MFRPDGTVDFCNGQSLESMEHASSEKWFACWARRVDDYYFSAAEVLNSQEMGFASVAIQCSAIEAIGTVGFNQVGKVGSRFERAAAAILDLNERDRKSLYYHFRCGLVHNGRINQSIIANRQADQLGAISYSHKSAITVVDGRHNTRSLVINPDLLLNDCRNGFRDWIETIDRDRFGNFIRQDFLEDIRIAKDQGLLVAVGPLNFDTAQARRVACVRANSMTPRARQSLHGEPYRTG